MDRDTKYSSSAPTKSPFEDYKTGLAAATLEETSAELSPAIDFDALRSSSSDVKGIAGQTLRSSCSQPESGPFNSKSADLEHTAQTGSSAARLSSDEVELELDAQPEDNLAKQLQDYALSFKKK